MIRYSSGGLTSGPSLPFPVGPGGPLRPGSPRGPAAPVFPSLPPSPWIINHGRETYKGFVLPFITVTVSRGLRRPHYHYDTPPDPSSPKSKVSWLSRIPRKGTEKEGSLLPGTVRTGKGVKENRREYYQIEGGITHTLTHTHTYTHTRTKTHTHKHIKV